MLRHKCTSNILEYQKAETVPSESTMIMQGCHYELPLLMNTQIGCVCWQSLAKGKGMQSPSRAPPKSNEYARCQGC